MIALIVLIGDDEFDAYESRLLDIMELLEGDCARRNDVRMVEKESDWKREVRIASVVLEVLSHRDTEGREVVEKSDEATDDEYRRERSSREKIGAGFAM